MARTKPNEQAQIDFIAELLNKGENRKTILAKFSKKWQSVAVRTFDTRLKAATLASQEQQKRIQALAEGEVAKKVEALESKIMSAIELQQFLTGIIQKPTKVMKVGNAHLMVNETIVDDKIVIEILPTETKLKAVDLFCKLIGAYSPDKHEHKIAGGLPSWLKPS